MTKDEVNKQSEIVMINCIVCNVILPECRSISGMCPICRSHWREKERGLS